MVKARDLIEKAVIILKANSLPNGELDAKVLLSLVTNLTKEEIFLKDPTIEERYIKKFLSYINRRAQAEPLAYILGEKEFFGLNFMVNQNVLIPRPDTEIMIEEALRQYAPNDKISILDLGTGSGCIVITLLHLLPKATAVAIDISQEALLVANQNAVSHKVQERISFIQRDMKNYFSSSKFDLIVSNPPYITSNDYNQLEATVRKFEPAIALIGGDTGLTYYNYIADLAQQNLKDNGNIILELGYNQLESVTDIFIIKGFICKKVAKDLAFIERVAIFQKGY